MTFSLTWLASVLRSAGLKVQEVDGWQSRGRAEMGVVKGILAHHTAGPKTGNAPSLNIVVHGRPDLPGPLSQLVLGRDGTFYVVAAGRTNHAGPGEWHGVTTGNSSFIGIEAENTGLPNDYPWPEVQMDAYARGCAAILTRAGAPVSMCAGHKEYALPKGRKSDPSFDMVTFRARVAAIMAGGAAVLNPTGITPEFSSADKFERESPKIIARLLKEFPELKDIHGAAACGSFGQETGGYTQFRQIGGNGIGLAQWDGSRRNQFLSWCTRGSRDPLTIATGLDYVVLELKGSERASLTALAKTTTLQEATRVFSERFERPGKPAMEKRQAYAQRALAAYRASKKVVETAAGGGGVVATIGAAAESARQGMSTGRVVLIVIAGIVITVAVVLVVRAWMRRKAENEAIQQASIIEVPPVSVEDWRVLEPQLPETPEQVK